MDIHLDLVGGIAGDMFIAALLDAFPAHEARVVEAVSAVEPQVGCARVPHTDQVLTGSRFMVTSAAAAASTVGATAPVGHLQHSPWSRIRSRLEAAPLSEATRRHALGIFTLLAAAEAAVHGIPADEVEFHEVGAWDSIADIVGAAALLEALGPVRWSASPVPLGGGRVTSAHGSLPVPAPATVRLLLGMPTVDDGIGGERATPTGAAILRYLCPPVPAESVVHTPAWAPRTLIAAGSGFGTRRLPGLSNHVRALCFEPCESAAATPRAIGVLEFEVDDQTGEDLALGLDRLREHAAVLDVTQTAVFGKKGRMMVHVRVLARSGGVDAVIDACFRETTTIGLRRHTVQGIGLERHFERAEFDARSVRVKVVERPGGRTAKAEAEDLRTQPGAARRAAIRAAAETTALGAPSDA